MKRRLLVLALVMMLCLGLVPTALAYETQDFSDVPSSHWAYDAVMKMADKGIINGVGGGRFDPNGQLTAEQFITLIGRIVFPDVKADGKDWSGPYVAEARANGFLTGTTITDGTLKTAITRYDMAVVLRAVAKYLNVMETLAKPSDVNDYGTIPNMYTEAVLAVYGAGLITGDDNGNFNGGSTMRRSEAATVMDRLLALQESVSSGTMTGPNGSTEVRKDDTQAEAKYAAMAVCKPRSDYDPNSIELVQGNDIWIDMSFQTNEARESVYRAYVYFRVGDTFQFTVREVPAGYGYTKDDVRWESTDESVAIVDEHGFVRIVGAGHATIRAKVSVIYYKNEWVDAMHSVTLYVDP